MSSLGAGFIGPWLLVKQPWHATTGALPTGVRRLGLAAGIVVLLAVLGVPGLLAGIDDQAAAPWFVLPAQVNWLGTYLLYPAWCLRLARQRRQPA